MEGSEVGFVGYCTHVGLNPWFGGYGRIYSRRRYGQPKLSKSLVWWIWKDLFNNNIEVVPFESKSLVLWIWKDR